MAKHAQIEKKLKDLENAMGVLQARKSAHAPFVLYTPWSLTRDEFYISYYPEGNYKKPVKHGPLSYAEASALLQSYTSNIVLQISMGECAEWLFVYHHYTDHAERYTPEQRERTKERELQESPELSYIDTEEGAEIRGILQKLPQTVCINLRDFRKVMGDV